MKETTGYKGAKFRVGQIATAFFMFYWLKKAYCTGVVIG